MAKNRPARKKQSSRTCTACSKVIFWKEIDAKIALMKRAFKEKGEKRVYRCPAGKGWHLTSKP